VVKKPHESFEEQKLELGQEHSVPTDPVTVSRQVVAAIQQYSDVTVDGTARVANRPAYELVLTPKPTEKTVLREVRIAVDSELRVPLRMAVLTNGTDTPAVQVGFSELNVGPQDASLFAFTPPAGAKVTEPELEEPTAEDKAAAEQVLTEANPQVIGEGWDVVVAVRTAQDALAGLAEQQEQRGQGRPQFSDGGDVDVEGLLKQLGKQVSGAWGSGTLITTRVGAVLVADDGRVVAGAVPEQVLVDAIGQVK
jgi:hypothetical protein